MGGSKEKGGGLERIRKKGLVKRSRGVKRQRLLQEFGSGESRGHTWY